MLCTHTRYDDWLHVCIAMWALDKEEMAMKKVSKNKIGKCIQGYTMDSIVDISKMSSTSLRVSVN